MTAAAGRPVPRWAIACLVLFLATLALYHLPWTRIGSAGAATPFFPLFAVPLIPIAVARAEPDVLRPLLPVALAFLGLVFATALTGIVNPGQDWAEALKRLGYLLLGVELYLVVAGARAALLAGVWAYVATAAAMSVYGFLLLLQGAARPLFYFGLHYTDATRNGDALFLLLPAFLAVGLALAPGGRRRRVLAGAAAASMLAGLTLSFSRGAWISAAFGLALLTGGRGRARRALLGGVAVLAAAVALVLPALSDIQVSQQLAARAASIVTLDGAGGNSNLQRAQLLAASVDLAAAHPVAGVGVDLIRPALFDSPVAGLAHAEDGYLNALVEYGVVGLAATLAFTAWPLVRCAGVRGDPLVRAAMCGLAAVAVDTLLNTPQSTADFWVLPLFLAAAAHRPAAGAPSWRATPAPAAP